jgi:hypothetical protein
MMARGHGSIPPRILNFTLHKKSGQHHASSYLTPGKAINIGRMGGSVNPEPSDALKKITNILPLTRIEPRYVSLSARDLNSVPTEVCVLSALHKI